MNYLDIANSHWLYAMAAAGVLLVLVQAIIFFVIAWRRGQKLGIPRDKMMAAVKSSAVFSIVPSLPILLALTAMVPVLGIPFPWLRLSVIGSAPYELLTADIGAKSMGVQGLGMPGYTPQVFGNSLWIMTLGILWSPVLFLLLSRRMQKGMNNIKKKDSRWMEIFISALFFGMLAVFIGQPVIVGGVPLMTILTGALFMFALTALVKKYNINWLHNFTLSISMIGAMAMAILYTRFWPGV
jgi:hypothetical protein